MRKLRRYIERLLPVVAVLALASCSLDEIDEVKKPTDSGDRWGSLTIESLVINTDNESLDRGSNSTRTDGENGTASSASETFKVPNPNNVAEDLDNYWIEVFDADGNVVDINGDATGTGMTYKDVVEKNSVETPVTLLNGDELKLKGIVLPPGQYTVWAYKDSTKGVYDATTGKGIANVAADQKGTDKTTTPAYYMGNQTVEVVSAEDLDSATSTPVAITCKLAQTLVTVEMSADMLKWFDEENENEVTGGTPLQTIVTIEPESPVENVDYSYTFPYSSNHGEKDADGVVVDGGPFVYFKDHAGAKGNTLSFKMEGVYLNVSVENLAEALTDLETNGAESEYTKNLTYVSMEREISNVTAAQWRQISFDIDHNTEGDVQFEVTISSYVFDEEIEVDVQTLFFGGPDKYQEETVPDIDPSAPVVTINTSDKSKNAVIAADLYDNSLVKWGANLEMTVTPNNGTAVTYVYADISSTNSELMEALAAAGYTDGRVTFLSSVSTISEDVNYFTIDATDRSKVTVALSDPGMTALQNTYPGTHSVRVWAEDSENRLNYTDLTIKSGDETGGNIGSASGGSGGGNQEEIPGLSVKWSNTDITYTEGSSEAVYVDIEAEKGMAGLTVQIDSDVLTADELGIVGLSQSMDLFRPATYAMESSLRSLGFLPYDANNGYENENGVSMPAFGYDKYRVYNEEGEEIVKDSPLKGETSKRFEITQFMGMLAMLGQSKNTFTLTVTDAEGKTVSSSATITIP